MTPIQPDAILVLSVINLGAALLLFLAAWFLLDSKLRPITAITIGMIWLWSLLAMLNFASGDTGFFSWFLDPSAEKNLVAMLNSTFLLMIAASAFYLFWKSLNQSPIWQRFYWFLLAILFAFLAADEYFSLHEGIVFWRGGYLILGGLTALLTLFMIWTDTGENRKVILLFLIGLGVMGVSGVVMDAFSAQNLLDIGPIKLDFIHCSRVFLGVRCSDYNNTEELLELLGSSLMAISLLAFARNLYSPKILGRWILALAGVWLFLVAGWLWLLPSLEIFAANRVQVDYGEMSLVAYSASQSTIEAGDTFDVTIYMRANNFNPKEYSLSVHLYTQALPELESIAQADMQLGEFTYPSRAWLPFLPMRNRFHLTIPDNLATNASYQLVAILWEGSPENMIAINSTNLSTLDNNQILVLDGIAALGGATRFPETPVYNFEAGIQLAAYQLPQTAQAGAETIFNFWWSTNKAQDIPLRQFLHFFHSETGEYVIFDQIPFAGRFPSQDWPINLFAGDAWTVTLPTDMPIGTYRIHTGLFRISNQERLPVADEAGTTVLDSSIFLGEVRVGE